jgi:GTP-binding protein
MALSGARGAGAPAVLDKLLEAIGHPEPGADEGDEASGWSPV